MARRRYETGTEADIPCLTQSSHLFALVAKSANWLRPTCLARADAPRPGSEGRTCRHLPAQQAGRRADADHSQAAREAQAGHGQGADRDPGFVLRADGRRVPRLLRRNYRESGRSSCAESVVVRLLLDTCTFLWAI